MDQGLSSRGRSSIAGFEREVASGHDSDLRQLGVFIKGLGTPRRAPPFVSHGDGELGVEEQGGLAAKGER